MRGCTCFPGVQFETLGRRTAGLHANVPDLPGKGGGGGGGGCLHIASHLARSPCEAALRSLANDRVRAMSDIPSKARPTLLLLGNAGCAESPLLAADGAASSPGAIGAEGGVIRDDPVIADPLASMQPLTTL